MAVRDRYRTLKCIPRTSHYGACVLIMMFSLAGVPPMVGFFGKFYVLRAAYDAGLDGWLLRVLWPL